MEKATISQLKNHLSRYLRKVRAGGAILILDRDRPVARLAALDPEARPGDRLARLELSGAVRRATDPVPLEALGAKVGTPGRSVLGALLEERRESR